jgi:hypothetical protein
VLEINFRPETPAERRAALQLMATLASAEAEPPQRKTKPWEPSAAPADLGASTAARSVPPEPLEEPAEIVSIDIPWPPSGAPDRTYGRNDVMEALQDYAQVNGAVALKQVLDRFGARRVSDIKPEHYAEIMTIARGELA